MIFRRELTVAIALPDMVLLGGLLYLCGRSVNFPLFSCFLYGSFVAAGQLYRILHDNFQVIVR